MDALPTLVSVSLAHFDTAVGNTIAFTCRRRRLDDGVAHPVNAFCQQYEEETAATSGGLPPQSYLDGNTPQGLKGLQDFCFPDGAHDTLFDVTPVAIRVARSGDGPTPSPPAATASPALDSAPSADTGDCLYGVAIYHLLKDAAAHRGARQRGVLIITRRPLFDSLATLARRVVLPLLATELLLAAHPITPHLERQDTASPGDVRQQHQEGHQEQHEPSAASTTPGTRRQERLLSAELEAPVLQGYVRRLFELVSSFVDGDAGADGALAEAGPLGAGEAEDTLRAAGGDLLARPWCCTSRTLRIDDPVAQFLPSATLPAEVAAALDLPAVHAAMRASVPRLVRVHLPLTSATTYDAMCHGVRVGPLLRRFGRAAAFIHFALLTRVPIVFVGATGEAVGEAVRAVMHLGRCLPIHHSRFVPYAPIDLIDRLVAGVSRSVFAAIGATNAYVMHRKFPGIAKCNINTGVVEFPSAGDSGPAVPKPYLKTWTATAQLVGGKKALKTVSGVQDSPNGGDESPPPATSAQLAGSAPYPRQTYYDPEQPMVSATSSAPSGPIGSSAAHAVPDIVGTSQGRELHLRARMAVFNRCVLKDFERQEGALYEHLCRRSNVVHAPLATASSMVFEDVATPVSPEPGKPMPSGDDEASQTPPASAAAADDEDDDDDDHGVVAKQRTTDDFDVIEPAVSHPGHTGAASAVAGGFSSPGGAAAVPRSPRMGDPDGDDGDDDPFESNASPLGALRETGRADPDGARPAPLPAEADPLHGLSESLQIYRRAAATQQTTLDRLHRYHETVHGVLAKLARDSGEQHQVVYDALFANFAVASGLDGDAGGNSGELQERDPGRLATDTELLEALREQIRRDDDRIARHVIECRQRAISAVDMLSKGNPNALRRSANIKATDFFASLGGVAPYNFGTQLLLASSPCNMHMTVSFDGSRTRKTYNSFGDIFVFRNYICFQASNFPLAEKCHQVFPFDHIVSLERAKNGTILGNSPSGMLCMNIVMKHRSYPAWRAKLSLGVNQPAGFFEMVQLLYNRQLQITDAVDGAFFRFTGGFDGTSTRSMASEGGASHNASPVPSIAHLRPTSPRGSASAAAAGHVDPQSPSPSERTLAGTAADFKRSPAHRANTTDIPPPPAPLVCPIVPPTALFSSVHIVVCDEVYENQRRYPLAGWSARLLPTDPPGFSDRSGGHGRTKESTLLCPGFVWVSDWILAPYHGPVMTDSTSAADLMANDPAAVAADKTTQQELARKFWAYGNTWGGDLDAAEGGTIRRRRWVRMRTLVPEQQQHMAPGAAGVGGASPPGTWSMSGASPDVSSPTAAADGAASPLPPLSSAAVAPVSYRRSPSHSPTNRSFSGGVGPGTVNASFGGSSRVLSASIAQLDDAFVRQFRADPNDASEAGGHHVDSIPVSRAQPPPPPAATGEPPPAAEGSSETEGVEEPAGQRQPRATSYSPVGRAF